MQFQLLFEVGGGYKNFYLASSTRVIPSKWKTRRPNVRALPAPSCSSHCTQMGSGEMTVMWVFGPLGAGHGWGNPQYSCVLRLRNDAVCTLSIIFNSDSIQQFTFLQTRGCASKWLKVLWGRTQGSYCPQVANTLLTGRHISSLQWILSLSSFDFQKLGKRWCLYYGNWP